MAIVLSLITAAVFGVGDFCGGVASKRAPVLHVVAGSHLVGAIGAVIAAAILADQFIAKDAVLGIAGGLFGVIGVAFLYRRLATGPMSVVAPLTAITSAAVPAIWGIASGERLSGLGWAGMLLALVAVVLVSMTDDDAGSAAPVTAYVVGESLLAGVGFGAMFIFLDATSEASAPWPVATARIFTAALLMLILVAGAKRGTAQAANRDKPTWGLIALVGIFDTFSNVTFIYASNLGQLSVVGVLSALYPISTVILARVVLGERMTRAQGLGFVAAMAGTELLVLG